ncbi:short-chain alcohol dehydrogenase family enzyme [Wolbachia endosymbiont of Armadillidium vulgare str. wVulC]|uniref:SDR family oxidoreductase n=1 Tax=Wolbachia endosymbiont of Armadillidium vulgare TaxID=77039 RepID=UPI00064948F8|nr:SDR family oxidoreductase [Wolbachia endosymbiont of Armadillidium vulgare]KLT23285.1 short-chain alcohol dehydrogenase family enzyme [Wolbachia endosymbiont of Armadillidium vulgare str. wVulC]OJH30866.1 putative oxidoreductase YciK [Wolbachia endosymbiont of Armadillidium vulgare]
MNLAKDKEMGKLEGKVALITGASGGIGSSVAKKLVKEGASVILISRSLDNLVPLYNEIEKFREGSVKLIQLDLLDFESVKVLPNMIENLKLSESGALDILVACTGILGKLNPIHDYEIEELQNVMNTNFTANWYLLKNLDPMLKKSNAGRVIFMTSEVTLSPSSYPYWMPYAASKVALEIMVQMYASETKHTNLCVNAVYLEGPVDSEMYKQAFPGKDTSELVPPDELTDKFVELASNDCSVSGKILPLSKSPE